MPTRFDVFERLLDGRPVWIGSFESLEEAKARLGEIALHAVGDCFIYSEGREVIEFIVHACADCTWQ